MNLTENRNKSSTYTFSSWAFQRSIGLAYLAAFGSLATQIVGLIGKNGILPIDHYAELARLNNMGFQALGALEFMGTSDGVLQAVCWIGVVASTLICLGVATPVMFLLCWFLWLSLVNVGQDFLSFQWDILLLEAGFLSIFIAPWRLIDWPAKLQPSSASDVATTELAAPPVVSIWLFRWLLFRLMLESGLCKIFSGDPTWRSLTAMCYHYHTQPLPTPSAWFCDKYPELILKIQTLLTFFIELVCPLFVFVKRLRLTAAGFFMLLQLCIALTGNYAYFNLLTFSLCFFLIDDSDWRKIFSFTRKSFYFSALPCRFTRVQKILASISGLLVLTLSISGIEEQLVQLPLPLTETMHALNRYYVANTYGLFATMTTTRDEIILEGSNDGVNWLPYEFRFKPSAISQAPSVVAPLQPRLDWQMWFASLADLPSSPWFAHFVVKLFQGSAEVLGLLKINPFPNSPPAYLRANLYTYTFSDWNQLINQGNWWRREYKREFLPVVSRAAVMQQLEQVARHDDRMPVSPAAQAAR